MSGSKEITRQCDESDAWQDEAAAVEDPEHPVADPPAEFAAFMLRRARGPLSLWASGHLNVRERWAASQTDGPAWSDAAPCRVHRGRSPFASWTQTATPSPSPTRPPVVIAGGGTPAELPFSDGPSSADANSETGAAEKTMANAPKPDVDDDDDKRQPPADEEESSDKE